MNFFANVKETLRLLNGSLDIDTRNKKNPVKTKIIFAGISLGAAICLWLFVGWNGSSEITRTFNVAVEYTKPGAGLDCFHDVKMVSVKLAGNMATLSRLNKTQLSAKVLCEGIAAGKYDLPVLIDAPAGVRVVSWKPSLVAVEIYKKYEKLLPVSLKPLDEQEEETDTFSCDILPASALVTGPRRQIEAIESLEARVAAAKLKEGNTCTVELVAVDKDNKPVANVSIKPKSVVVKPQEAAEGTPYPIKVKLRGQPEAGYEISSVRITPQEIRLKGSNEELENIRQIEFPAIDVAGLKGNMQTVLPIEQLGLGSGIQVVGTDSVTVDITVRKGLANKTFEAVPIAIKGARHGDKWSCTPATATVIAEGTRTQLESAKELPFTVEADVTSIVTAKITLPLIIKNVKNGVKILNIEPEEVTLIRE